MDRNSRISKKIAKADSTINEITNLLEFGYYNTAVNRIFYACFYSVQALLLSVDLEPKSHKGVRTLFSFHFVKNGKIPKDLEDFYTRIFDERSFADYSDEDEMDKESLHFLLADAKKFIDHNKQLLGEENK
jgi:uncharacterized protein (UPF0332 family)